MRRLLCSAVLLITLAAPALADNAEDCLSRSNDPAVAIAACTRDLEAQTKASEKADTLVLRGYAKMRANQHADAVADFDEALKLAEGAWMWWRPEVPNPYYWRGLARLRLGDARAALVDFDLCINQNPNLSYGHLARGQALEAMGRKEWALSSYVRALALHASEGYDPIIYREDLDPAEVKARIERLEAELKAAGEATDLAGTPATVLKARLYKGETAGAVADLSALIAAEPGNADARFALGATYFVRAVERLGQSLYRHGLMSGDDWITRDLLFLRFPLPVNPAPEPLSYEQTRAILKAFVDDLAMADAELAGVGADTATIPMNIGLIRLDLNLDGKADDTEALWRVYAAVSGLRLNEAGASRFTLKLDAGDAAWLRGYSHLLRAIAEFLLAHDWKDGFDHSFHRFFPQAKLPHAWLDDLLVEQRPLWDNYRKCLEASENQYQSSNCYTQWPSGALDSGSLTIADILTFIHLMHWEVTDKQAMARALAHLEAMIEMSRLSWTLIQAETDDDDEWIPNPRQVGPMPGMAVNQRMIDGWLGFLDQFDGLLKGKLLLGHWRLKKGINLRRVFLEPTAFDPILWAQGSAAEPYLEDGPQAIGDTWRQMESVFGGDFFRYVIWFN